MCRMSPRLSRVRSDTHHAIVLELPHSPSGKFQKLPVQIAAPAQNSSSHLKIKTEILTTRISTSFLFAKQCCYSLREWLSMKHLRRTTN